MERRGFLSFLGALLGRAFPSRAQGRTAPPTCILIMRHAEKTDDKNDMHLNARGYERAEALPRLFPSRFETPNLLFATKASARSNRPVETITPLAKALRLRINDTFANDEYEDLAKELLSTPSYGNRIILVCWHHGRIPALASALGVPEPPAWPETQYDRIWRVEFNGARALLADKPQRLLSGDS